MTGSGHKSPIDDDDTPITSTPITSMSSSDDDDAAEFCVTPRKHGIEEASTPDQPSVKKKKYSYFAADATDTYTYTYSAPASSKRRPEYIRRSERVPTSAKKVGSGAMPDIEPSIRRAVDDDLDGRWDAQTRAQKAYGKHADAIGGGGAEAGAGIRKRASARRGTYSQRKSILGKRGIGLEGMEDMDRVRTKRVRTGYFQVGDPEDVIEYESDEDEEELIIHTRKIN